jgi:erythronate-4-phosphate dehydrogenase
MAHFIADENMPLLDECFGQLGSITRLPGRQLEAKDLKDADALLVRSVTHVNRELLEGSSIRFVGTATIGTDHLDIQYLKQQGVHHVSAPGCNADSVAEYIVACLAHLVSRRGFSIASMRAGVIGAGNVGTRVAYRLGALGIPHMIFDPLRHDDANDPFMGASLDDLSSCDLICCHAPLTQSGEHPSHQMINENFLSKLKDGAILISAGRGPVIDFGAIRAHLDRLTLCLDVWDPEPDVPTDFLDQVEICTPHVAGYSMQSKWRGTTMLLQSFCKFKGIQQPLVNWPEDSPSIEHHQTDWTSLVLKSYDPWLDSQNTRQKLSNSRDVGQSFDLLRKNYSLRHEFNFPSISCSSMPEDDLDRLKRLGFRVHIK